MGDGSKAGNGKASGGGSQPSNQLGFIMIFAGSLFLFQSLVLFPSGVYEYFYGIPGYVPVLICSLPVIIAGFYIKRTDERKIPLWVYSLSIVAFSLSLFIAMLTTRVSINYVSHTSAGILAYSHEEVLVYSLMPIIPVFEIALAVLYFVPPAAGIDGQGIRYPVSRYERAMGRETRVITGEDVKNYYLLYGSVQKPKSETVADKYRLTGLGFLLKDGERIHYGEFYSEPEIKALIEEMEKTPKMNWKKKYAESPLMSREEWRKYGAEKKTAERKKLKQVVLLELSIFSLTGGMFLTLIVGESAGGIMEILLTFIFLILLSILPIVFLVGTMSLLKNILDTWVDTQLLATYLRLEEETNQTLIPVLDISKGTKKYLGIDDSARSPLQ